MNNINKYSKSKVDSYFVSTKESRGVFYLILFYLFLEYGRPQTFLPFLSPLHLPTITIILLGLTAFISGKLKWHAKQTKLYLMLLALMLIQGPIASNNYWAFIYFVIMLLNFIVYLSISSVIDKRETFEKFFSVWFMIHVFLSIIGIIKSGKGIGGFLADENDFCVTINMIIPFSFFLCLYETGNKRLKYLLLTCIFLLVIVITGSRGGFVGLTTTCIYCWFRTKKKALTAFFVAFLAIFTIVVAPPTYWNEIRSITEEGTRSGTGEERMYTWRIGWHMFLDNPLIGVGQGNFPYVFRKYEVEAGFGEEGYHGRSVAGRAAHSIYFTILPELGLIGTILFIAIVILNIKDINWIKKISFLNNKKKPNKNEKLYFFALACEGSLLTFLISGSFISILYYPNFWILMGFILSLKNITLAEAGEDPKFIPDRKRG